MTKKEMKTELARRGVKFGSKDNTEKLQQLLDDTVIVDDNAATTTAEDDITSMVIDGITEPIEEADLIVKTTDVADKNAVMTFITAPILKGKKWEFTTQDSNRKSIEKYTFDTKEEADLGIKQLLKK